MTARPRDRGWIVLLAIGAVLVGSMVPWMWRAMGWQ